jgi:hypothetical protein
MLMRIDMITGDIDETRCEHTSSRKPSVRDERCTDERLQPALQETAERDPGYSPRDALLAELDIEALIKSDT